MENSVLDLMPLEVKGRRATIAHSSLLVDATTAPSSSSGFDEVMVLLLLSDDMLVVFIFSPSTYLPSEMFELINNDTE